MRAFSFVDAHKVTLEAIDRAQAAVRAHVERPQYVRRGVAATEAMRLEGEYAHGGASCVVEWAPPLPEMARWVRRVYTQPESRRRGDATALMESLCAQADALGMALILEPRAEDGIDDAALERWYRRMGFVTAQRKPVLLLARGPRR